MTLSPRIPPLRIGTRASKLACVQSEMARTALVEAHPELGEVGRIEIMPMTTSGDVNKDVPLFDIGGKGLFTKEIEEALLAGAIDIAVHSLKDVPGFLPPGLVIGAVLPREDPRDTFLSPHAEHITGLPPGATFGTSSPRRAAQALMQRPDLLIRPLRGNVPTRIAKIIRGEAHGTFLAMAGLNRLGIAGQPHTPLSTDEMLPAIAQGTLALECRESDGMVRELLRSMTHEKTEIETAAERALLATLDGSCRTPIAGYAEIRQNRLFLQALVASLDGKVCYRCEREGDPADAALLGKDAGQELLARGGLRLIRGES